jgi:hypothetical protein
MRCSRTPLCKPTGNGLARCNQSERLKQGDPFHGVPEDRVYILLVAPFLASLLRVYLVTFFCNQPLWLISETDG